MHILFKEGGFNEFSWITFFYLFSDEGWNHKKLQQHFEFVGEPLGEDPTFVKLELVHEPLGEMAPAALGKDGALGTELHASLKTFLE